MRSRVLAALSGVFILIAAALPATAQNPGSSSDTIRLSLEEAVTLGLRVSDEIHIAAAQADIASAQLTQARAALIPSVRMTSSFGRTFEQARSSAVNPLFSLTNTYGVAFQFSQPLFQGGRLWNGARAASATASATRLNAVEQRSLYTVQLQRAYLAALLAERLVQLQETNVQLASSRLTQVEQFQTAGRAAQYDVLRARVERANIEPLAIQARSDREMAYLELKQLLNLPPEQSVVLTSVIDPTAAQVMVASYLDSALTLDRPALRAAELTAQSRRLGVSVARADLLPTVSFFFNTGFGAFPPIGYGFPTMRGYLDRNSTCPAGSPPTRLCQNGGWFEDRSLGINFSWAIFDGLRAKSVLDAAQAARTIAELQLRQEHEQVSMEVARARAELRRAKAFFDGRRQTAGEAQEAFKLASLRFTRGLSTQIEVSDAQLALLTAESNESRATFDLYLATSELARALGRPIPMPATRPLSRTSDP